MKAASDVMLNKIIQKCKAIFAPKGEALTRKDDARNLNVQIYTADVKAKFFVVKVVMSTNEYRFWTACIDYYQIPPTNAPRSIILDAENSVGLLVYMDESGRPVFKTVENNYIAGVASYM